MDAPAEGYSMFPGEDAEGSNFQPELLAKIINDLESLARKLDERIEDLSGRNDPRLLALKRSRDDASRGAEIAHQLLASTKSG